MLDEIIEDQERLYRRVPIAPNFWNYIHNRPSSAVFKDPRGTSVDRLGERTPQQVIDNFIANFQLKAVVSVLTQYCRQIGAHPIYTPYPPNADNIYHAEIHNSIGVPKISGGKASSLSESAIIDHVTI